MNRRQYHLTMASALLAMGSVMIAVLGVLRDDPGFFLIAVLGVVMAAVATVVTIYQKP